MGCCLSPPRSTSLEDLAEFSKQEKNLADANVHQGAAMKPHHGAAPVKCALSSPAAERREHRAAQDLTPMAEGRPGQTPFSMQSRCTPVAPLAEGPRGCRTPLSAT